MLTQNWRRFFATGVSLSLTLLPGYRAGAQQGWDPNGTSSIGGSGVWDTTSLNWTPNGTETQVASGSLVAFTPGDVALFCAGPSSSSSQGSFAVSVSGAITCGGTINGNGNPGSCNITINDGGGGSLVVPSGGAIFETGGSVLGTTTFNIPLTGTGAITATFSGSLTLSGTNTYSGNTTISSSPGKLTIGGSGQLGGGTYGGTIANAGFFIYSSSAPQTLSGAITGAGTLTDSGSGQLTLSGTNTYTGTTSIGSGSTLLVSGTGSLGSGTYTNNLTNNGAFIFASSTAQTLKTGVISGTGTFTQGGGVTTTLGGTNTFTGAITITNGLLAFSADGNLGAVPGSATPNAITLNGGVNSGLRATATMTLNANRGITLGANGGEIQVASSDTLTYGGIITGNANFQAGQNPSTGLGTLVLSGANSYTGMTAIACGTLRLGANGTLPAGTPLVVAAAGSGTGLFDLNGHSQTIGTLASSPGINGNGLTAPGILLTGALTVTESNNTAFSGIISSAGGSLTLNGPDTLTLNYTNTYTGATTISSGTLALGSTGSISNTSAINIAAGGVFDVSAIPAFSLTTSNALSASGTATPAVIKGASGGTVSLGAQPITLAYDGSDAALTITQGTLYLNGNSFTVNGAVLPVGMYTIISQSSGSISNTGTFTAAGSVIGAGTTGGITVIGGSVKLNISGSNAPVTITGITRLGNGTAELSFSGAANDQYLIEAATNLIAPITWTVLSTNTAGTNGLFQYNDVSSTNYPVRFYRTAVQ